MTPYRAIEIDDASYEELRELARSLAAQKELLRSELAEAIGEIKRLRREARMDETPRCGHEITSTITGTNADGWPVDFTVEARCANALGHDTDPDAAPRNHYGPIILYWDAALGGDGG